MNYGFVDYKGIAWHNSSVDTYNRFDAEVVKRDKPDMVKGSLAHKELEHYKDQRHKVFVQLGELT